MFTFKKTAAVIFGPIAGYGFTSQTLADGDVFAMPGPFEQTERVHATLNKLGQRWRENSSTD